MLRPRVIPCLLLSGEGLVKTRRFQAPKYVGDPINAIRIFNEKEVDELMVLDIGASASRRPPNFALIEQIAGECFMPLCYGGGIRDAGNARRLFAAGVEKICLQSAFFERPSLVTDIADHAGGQAVMVSIDVERDWRGRRRIRKPEPGASPFPDWQSALVEAAAMGAGEILLTSVERDGTFTGLDLDLIAEGSALVDVPLVASGGASSLDDIAAAVAAGASAVAAGALFVFYGPHRAVLITYPSRGELNDLAGCAARAKSNEPSKAGLRGPDFVCIGPANSATTWIADQLKFQRDVWMPPIQESSFLASGLRPFLATHHLHMHWDLASIAKRMVRNRNLSAHRDRDFLRHARSVARRPDAEFDRDSYFELFRPAGPLITGDIAPIYASMDVESIRRLSPWLERARVFTVIRDPVDRFWGALARHFRYATLGEDTDYGSVETVQRLFHDPVRSLQHFPTEVVANWNEGLGPGRLKVFFFDDLRRDSQALLGSILDYIGSDSRKRVPFVPIDFNRKRNSARPNITREAKEWVRLAFQNELDGCAEQFGDYGKAWRAKHSQPIPPDPQGTVHVRSPTAYRHPLS